MSNLDGTIWQDGEGDHMEVTVREDGTVYGMCGSFDFHASTQEEAREQLLKWDFHQVGVE